MISFNKDKQIFQLDTVDFSYVLGVKERYLVHYYAGKRIPAGEDLSGMLFRGYQSSFTPEPAELADRGKHFYPGNIPTEYPTEGGCDYRSSAFAVKNADGNRVTELRYAGYETEKGKPKTPGLPSLYANEKDAETLKIFLSDSYTGARVTLYYTVFAGLNALVRRTKIENTGDKPFSVETALSLCLDLPTCNWDFLHLWGEYGEERSVSRTPLTHGIQEISSKRGASGHYHNPFAALVSRNADEECGECFGVNLVYSGNFEIRAEVDGVGGTRLLAGMNYPGFSWMLAPGEAFDTPECVLVYSSAGLGEMSRTFHRLYLDHLIPAKWAYEKRPILINSWEAAYFNFDTDKLIDFARHAKELGIEMLVMDDGWFGHRDNDRSSLGDWYVYEKKLDLGRLSKTVHELGMKLGIWYEPEMISPESDLFRAHPDWIVKVPGREPSLGRHQYVLDFSREDVRENILSQMASVLDRYEIDYVKWDFNRNLTEAGSACLPPERAGEFYHRYMLGLYAFLETFTKKYPKLLLESCSGGGGRFDAGWLAYSPQIWCSDNTFPIDRCRIQYGTSLCYPASCIGAHVSHKDASCGYEMRACVAMAGTFGYEMDPRTFTEEEKTLVREQIGNYHRYYDTVHCGDLYRITSPYESARYIWSYVSRDKKTCLLSIAAFSRVFTQDFFIKLHGLDPGKTYFCQKLDLTASGARLMNAGINLWGELRSAGDSAEYLFEEVNG